MTYFILGTKLDPTNYTAATTKIVEWAKLGESRSVFAANTHLVIECYDSPALRAIANKADLVTPDGMPLVWWLRLKGIKNQARVYGPDLMLQVCQSAAQNKIPIGLLGSTQEIISSLAERLKNLFPGLQINFCHSPAFQPMNQEDDYSLLQNISASGARILFVGLGCPKQELWIGEHKDRLMIVMCGVGAAFQFHAGVVRQAPTWMQNNGLEWFYRLIREPARLWKRYLTVIPRFSWLVLLETLGLIHVQ